jgi:tetratricopeptide (TPR) repeat protein
VILGLLLTMGLPGVQAQRLLPEQSIAYRQVYQVFSRLTYVFANSRPQPQLQILARDFRKASTIAQYVPGHKPLIQVDEEVYDLCRTLGKDSLNALAVLLGHELTHHYRNHDWYDTFGIGKTDRPPQEDIKRIEAEADFYGCFYGELAGYTTGPVFPHIMDLVYERFHLPDAAPGYPSKAERKVIYQKKQTEAAGMVAVFRAGQVLYLLKEFASAAQCFDYLVNKFPSREILHNLSSARLQQALQLYHALGQPPFAYPVELDARSRLETVQRLPPGTFKLTYLQQLLGEARKYAEKARETDPEYIPAFINLACIFSLLGNQPAAVGVINELGPGHITANAHTIRGIAYFKDQQLEKARKDFEAARRKNAYLAAYNLALFLKLTDESVVSNLMGWVTNWFTRQEEAPSGNSSPCKDSERTSQEVTRMALSSGASQLLVSEKPYLAVQWQDDASQIKLEVQAGPRNYLLQYTRESSSYEPSGEVMPGAMRTDLVYRYGEPTYRFAGASGEYWVYADCNLAFEVNKQGRITARLRYTR